MNQTAKESFSKYSYPLWYKNKIDHVFNNIIFSNNLECKDNNIEKHAH